MSNTVVVCKKIKGKRYYSSSTTISGVGIHRTRIIIHQSFMKNGETTSPTWNSFIWKRRSFVTAIQMNINSIGFPRTIIKIDQVITRNGKILPTRWSSTVYSTRRNTIAKLKYTYGVTERKAKEIIESRENAKCEVCQKRGKTMGQDHNHTTGRLRGLLCNGCNIVVGIIEGPYYLKAKEYLERWDHGFGQATGG